MYNHKHERIINMITLLITLSKNWDIWNFLILNVRSEKGPEHPASRFTANSIISFIHASFIYHDCPAPFPACWSLFTTLFASLASVVGEQIYLRLEYYLTLSCQQESLKSNLKFLSRQKKFCNYKFQKFFLVMKL